MDQTWKRKTNKKLHSQSTYKNKQNSKQKQKQTKTPKQTKQKPGMQVGQNQRKSQFQNIFRLLEININF